MTGRMSAELPSGTLTYLLTDIERSTALWEEHGEAMARAVERHEQIISKATEAAGGVVVRSRGEGDSCFCVFTAASGAVAAALEAQRALHSEPWPGPRVTVRMAIHTGAAELREGQYYGTVVNRCARLRGIGHGGQTLLSSAASKLVLDALPAPSTLADLGAHRLPDLTQPERVYQLCHPELPEAFPALESLDAYPNNLPIQLTRFVGRERELAEIGELLADGRLVTITGPGGCGKTRLSLQVAADLLGRFPDGVWFASLAAISDGDLVGAEIASALGLREEPSRALVDTIAHYLGRRRVLLVLDNCEHVLGSAAEVVATLLARCSELEVIATSRQALGIEGETALLLHPLSVPADDRVAFDELVAYDGVQLLSDRAALARATFAVTERNAAAVAQICRRLDGIPLAIELAAARLGSLGPDELARRLDDRFRLLAGGRRSGPTRHQTLDAAVDWSYELCDDAERLLFRRLAGFVGAFTLEAAENVCGFDGLDAGGVASLLSQLVDRSLVYADSDEITVTYRMLQTIRAFAIDRLEGSGEASALRRRHCDWFGVLAEESEEHLFGADQEQWLSRLEFHHDDIRAALSWSLGADPARAVRLAGALGVFWDARGHWTEGRRWLEAALAAAPEDDPSVAVLLTRLGNLAYEQGDYATSRSLLARSLARWRERDDVAGTAHALSLLADLEIASGNLPSARDAFEEALPLLDRLGGGRPVGILINLAMAAQALSHPGVEDLYREALTTSRQRGHKRGTAGSLVGLGTIARARGDLDAARLMHEEALSHFRELDDSYGTAETLSSLAAILRELGGASEATALMREALPLYRGLGDRRGTATTLIRLGVDASRAGEVEPATELLGEALAINRELEDPQGIVACLTHLARLNRLTSDASRAAALLSEAIEWCRRMPAHRATATCLEEVAGLLSGSEPRNAAKLFGAAEVVRASAASNAPRSGQQTYERDVAAVRSALGEDAFERAWDEGRLMSPEDTVSFARELRLYR